MRLFCNPIAAVAFRHAVLGFAGHDAIMAAHAPAGIDHHAKARHRQASVSMVTKFTFMPVPPIKRICLVARNQLSIAGAFAKS